MQTITLGQDTLRVTELCLGCMQLGARATADTIDALLDTYRDAGGNFLDTAHCYCFWEPGGDGISERVVGEYLHRNRCRDEMVIATKGAHPPVPGYRAVEDYMSPSRLESDIDDSLGRMKIDTIDLYWLHRDDPRVGVGEIIDMLLAEKQRGVAKRFVTLTVDAGASDAPYMSTIWRNGTVVGETTSGAWGYRVGASIALGTVRVECTAPGTELEIEIFGERRAAVVQADRPLWDPENARLRA